MRSPWFPLLAPILWLSACGNGPDPADTGRPATDAPAPAPVDAPTIDWAALPPNVWSFVPIPGGVCGNGTQYSVGVNPRPGATQVLFLVMGGGACWDTASCFELDAASHISEEYTRAIFDRERALVSMIGWDDRGAPLNPFRESHIVFMPYCTGDLHSGDAVQEYPGAPGGVRVHHRGAVNMQGTLDLARAAWSGLADVRVIGFSAGGYGTQLNWGRFADAWPAADVALLGDCSPLLQPQPDLYATWRSSWNMQTPADCADCASTFAAYDDYYDARYPESRFGLMATTRDTVIRAFWGGADLEPLLDTLVTDHLEDNETTRYFIVDSDAHVILGDAFTLRSADGTLLVDWLAGWLEDDARFHNTRP